MTKRLDCRLCWLRWNSSKEALEKACEGCSKEVIGEEPTTKDRFKYDELRYAHKAMVRKGNGCKRTD